MLRFASKRKFVSNPSDRRLTPPVIHGMQSSCTKSDSLVDIQHNEPPLKLATIHKHPRDDRIQFRESDHFYTLFDIQRKPIDFSRVYPNGKIPSVSSIAHDYFDHFDEHKMAGILASHPQLGIRPKWSRYRDCIMPNNTEGTRSNIIAMWEKIRVEASSKGTEMHSIIEYIYNNASPVYEDTETVELGFFDSYKKLIESRGWRPFRTEWRLFSEYYAICGTIDMIFIDPEGRLHMVDWKRSKEIKFSGYDKGRGICQGMENCNYIHYCLQLNTYKFLIERYYNTHIVDMHLAVFHPKQSDYQIINVPDTYQPLVGKLLKQRRNRLESRGYDRDDVSDSVTFSNADTTPAIIINGGYAVCLGMQHIMDMRVIGSETTGLSFPGLTPFDLTIEYFDGARYRPLLYVSTTNGDELTSDILNTNYGVWRYSGDDIGIHAHISRRIVWDETSGNSSIHVTKVAGWYEQSIGLVATADKGVANETTAAVIPQKKPSLPTLES